MKRKSTRGVVDVRHPRPLRRREHVQVLAASTDDGQISRAVEHGQQQKIASRGRQMIDSAGEQPLQPLGQRQHPRQRPTRPASDVQRDRQLEQRERIALSLGQQPTPCTEREARETSLQQRPRVCVRQRLELVRLEPAAVKRRAFTGAHRSDQSDAHPGHPTRDIGNRRCACPVQPVHIINHHQDRFNRSDGSHQPQCRSATARSSDATPSMRPRDTRSACWSTSSSSPSWPRTGCKS